MRARLVAKLSTFDLGGRQEGDFAIGAHEVPLYEGTQPLWREHRVGGSSFDVVAFPWDRPDTCPEFMHYAANRVSNVPVEPGCTVFVVG